MEFLQIDFFFGLYHPRAIYEFTEKIQPIRSCRLAAAIDNIYTNVLFYYIDL